MKKKLPELLVFFTLFVLPLLHNSIENSTQTRRMWSWCLLISAVIIVFFVTYPFRVHRIFYPLTLLVGVIGFSSFALAMLPVNPLALYLVVLTTVICVAVQSILRSDKKNFQIFIVMMLGFFCLYAQWGIAQFIVQHDLGLSKIGESILNQNTAGVASFYIGSEKLIRAYGPFAHANSFGGVLLLGVVLLYQYARKFPNKLFTQAVAFILSLGILVSFSRSAIVGLLALGLLVIWKKRSSILLPTTLAVALLTPLLFQRSLGPHGAAVYERIVGFRWYADLMSIEVLLRGFGLGNYTTALTNFLQTRAILYNPWDIAPIHNVPLFLVAELGILISIPLAIFLARYIAVRRLWIFVVLAPALFFDHYFATQLAPLVFLITSTQIVVQ